MPLDLNGNKLYKTTIGPKSEIQKYITTDGLTMHLDAYNKNSYSGTGTTINDLTSYAYNGTLTNGAAYSNGYLTFDGVDDYVTMGTAMDFATYTSGFTIDLWVYPTSAAAFSAIFSSAYGTSGTQWQVYVWYNTASKFGTTQRYGGNQNDFNTSNTFAINNWYNVVVTSNSSFSYIYVNGVNQVSSATGQIDNQPGSREVRLGNFKNYPAQYTGRIATCRVYSRALLDTEIRENYYAQKSRFGL